MRTAAAFAAACVGLIVMLTLVNLTPSVVPLGVRLSETPSVRLRTMVASTRALLDHPLVGTGPATHPGHLNGNPFDAHFTLLTYPPSTIHPFKELVVLVPVRVGDVEGNYVPYIYVTTDEALIPGREIAGFPKKMADIVWERDGNAFRGSVTRWDKPILSLTGSILAALPPEIAAAQAEAARRPTINYKLIPGPAGEIEVEEITAVDLDIVTHEVEMGFGRVHCEPSDLDPVADLVPDAEGPLLAIRSDNTIPAGRVLRRIERAAAAAPQRRRA
jgi:acetoacetate decarboxylase